jgi:hypothetical protein
MEFTERHAQMIEETHSMCESFTDWAKGSLDRGTVGADERIRANTKFRKALVWGLKIAGGVIITGATAAAMAGAF